jgi:hypothetical protein
MGPRLSRPDGGQASRNRGIPCAVAKEVAVRGPLLAMVRSPSSSRRSCHGHAPCLPHRLADTRMATISTFAIALGVLGCLVIAGSPLALRFLAETAKADLEKADVRRPLSESLKDHVRRSDWSRLSLDAALGALFLGFGVHQLMPRRVTVMHVASAGPHFWTLGVPGVVLGGWMVLSALLQIRTKVSADEHR